MLQLLRAAGILDDVGVEVARAPDLELDLVRLLVLLYARRYLDTGLLAFVLEMTPLSISNSAIDAP